MLDQRQLAVLDTWLEDRQRARTDLFWLLTEVLQYRDIERKVHDPIIEHLQKFPGGTDYVNKFSGKFLKYEPKVDLWHLQGPRKRLILYPRGHLKTTIITIGHSIQWILNYSDIRIMISSATGEQVKKVVTEIKAHFQFNNNFYFLFPEYCPERRKAGDFGTQEAFTVPCRKRKWLKEQTVSTCSVGKVIAGAHMEVHKHSDLVDKENIRTPDQIRTVRDHYRYMGPLLERGPIPPHHGWEDIEGTRYDFSDLYGTEVIDKEEKLPEGKRQWAILIDAAERPDGSILWPTRFPKSELEIEKQKMGDVLFAAQYLNNPIPDAGGLATREEIKFVPREIVRRIPLRVHCTIDLHGMEQGARNDFTVFNVTGFDRDARAYMLDLRHKRFTPFEVIDNIFDIFDKWKCDFKIEKDAHARVLLPFLTREMSKRGKYPIIIPIQRDNRVSKKQRIWGLQAWFKGGIIRFCEDLDCRIELTQEVLRFSQSSSYHDDILDTMADQMQNREGGVSYDLYPDEAKGENVPEYMRSRAFTGFDPITKAARFLGDKETPASEWFHPGTGL